MLYPLGLADTDVQFPGGGQQYGLSDSLKLGSLGIDLASHVPPCHLRQQGNSRELGAVTWGGEVSHDNLRAPVHSDGTGQAVADRDDRERGKERHRRARGVVGDAAQPGRQQELAAWRHQAQ